MAHTDPEAQGKVIAMSWVVSLAAGTPYLGGHSSNMGIN